MIAIWPFFKLFARNKMIWSLCLFLMLNEKGLFSKKSGPKVAIFI